MQRKSQRFLQQTEIVTVPRELDFTRKVGVCEKKQGKFISLKGEKSASKGNGLGAVAERRNKPTFVERDRFLV